jgi:ABC-2 type transport system permease protein
MIFHIAKKEFIQTLRDSRFRVMALIIFMLMLTSVLVSRSYYQKLSREHQQARQTARAHWENQGDKNPHSAAHFGTFAFKPVQPLSLIDNGLDKYVGISIFMEAHRQNDAEHKQMADSSSLARFGELTPAFVFTYLIPLLIILMAFSVFSAEKESGTLRMLLSQGVSKTTLAWGKITGIWLLLAALLLPVFLAGLLFLMSSPAVSGEELGRYGYMVLVYLLYFGIFIHVSVLVSALSRNSTVALVALLGFWMLSCLLVPRVTTNLSKKLYPSPNPVEFQMAIKKEIEEGVDGHNPFNEVSQKFEKEILAKYGVDSVSQLPFNYWGLIMQKGEEHETGVYARHLQNLQDIYLRQLRFHQTLSFLSPTVLARMLSMQFARTDLLTHYHFQKTAENYRVALVRELNYDLKDNSKYDDWNYTAGRDLFKRNIRFSYQPVPLSETMGQAKAALGLLVLWFAFSLVAALFGSHRMNVTA